MPDLNGPEDQTIPRKQKPKGQDGTQTETLVKGEILRIEPKSHIEIPVSLSFGEKKIEKRAPNEMTTKQDDVQSQIPFDRKEENNVKVPDTRTQLIISEDIFVSKKPDVDKEEPGVRR